MKVNVNDIKINPGRRSVSQDGIEELAFSISEIGLLNPITLTADYTLVAGLHRLEAVKSLGWSDVECTITDLNGLTAQLAELDDTNMQLKQDIPCGIISATPRCRPRRASARLRPPPCLTKILLARLCHF